MDYRDLHDLLSDAIQALQGAAHSAGRRHGGDVDGDMNAAARALREALPHLPYDWQRDRLASLPGRIDYLTSLYLDYRSMNQGSSSWPRLVAAVTSTVETVAASDLRPHLTEENTSA